LENNDRLRNVLTECTKRFDWPTRAKSPPANTGVGLACGTDKGSVVACCAEVTVDPGDRSYKVTRITQVFECGKILNPQNLHNQVAGAVVMGLGPAMREEMRFENGKMLNASFGEYHVPRFEDVPLAHFDIHLLDRPDLPSAGAGETPIIAIAPAIANALAAATKTRLRNMPLKLTDTATAKT
jgi:isoquinoline 1-oxidoreductase